MSKLYFLKKGSVEMDIFMGTRKKRGESCENKHRTKSGGFSACTSMQLKPLLLHG